MHSKGMFKILPNFLSEFDFSEHCIYDKQNHASFSSKVKRENGIMELVHSDIFGPMMVP